MIAFNLPPGCTLSDIEGQQMPRCEKCGDEFDPEREETLCEDCRLTVPDNESAQELVRSIETYRRIQRLMIRLISKGRLNTARFQNLWRASETLKNCYGGMPPNQSQ